MGECFDKSGECFDSRCCATLCSRGVSIVPTPLTVAGVIKAYFRLGVSDDPLLWTKI